MSDRNVASVPFLFRSHSHGSDFSMCSHAFSITKVPYGQLVQPDQLQIRKPNDLKLFNDGRRPILRGLALQLDKENAFLLTWGYVPSLLTYPGREVLFPSQGPSGFRRDEFSQVLEDTMPLTKVDFNAASWRMVRP